MTSYSSNVEMYSVNNSKLREHLAISSKCSLREFLILLNIFSILYYRRIEINNNHPEKDYTNPVDSSNLSYARCYETLWT